VLMLGKPCPVLDEIGAADGSWAFAPAAEKGRTATSFLIVDRTLGAVVVANNPINHIDPLGLFSWETVKSSFTLNFGIGPSIGIKGKLGPVKAGATLGLKAQAQYNTAEGLSVGPEAAAQGYLGLGKYKGSIGPSYKKTVVKDGQVLDCPEVEKKTWDPSLEREVGEGSIEASPWSVGATIDPLIGSIGINVDLKTFWKGLWE